MASITATKARADRYRLLEEVVQTHVPVQIAGAQGIWRGDLATGLHNPGAP